MEKWEDVFDYEGIYEVSDYGKVRSKEGKVTFTELHGKRKWKQRILKQKKDKQGYFRISLYKKGKPKDFLVHRLVAFVFCIKKEDENIVNHKDGNPNNNHYTNLEWCTYKENSNHAFDNGLMGTNKVIYLLNEKTKEKKRFRSLAEASLYLKKNKGYLSYLLLEGKEKIGNYRVIKERDQNE